MYNKKSCEYNGLDQTITSPNGMKQADSSKAYETFTIPDCEH